VNVNANFVLAIKPIKSMVEIGIKGKISERKREKSSGIRTKTMTN